jgi:hypothetical protein
MIPLSYRTFRTFALFLLAVLIMTACSRPERISGDFAAYNSSYGAPDEINGIQYHNNKSTSDKKNRNEKYTPKSCAVVNNRFIFA